MKTITTLEELQQATAGTKFAKDMLTSINVNGNPMPHAYWNLILSIRDCKMYSKEIKPHRNWKISDVKAYFNVSGSAEKIAEILESYKNVLIAK